MCGVSHAHGQVWPTVTRSLKDFGIKCELNLVEGSMTVRTTRKCYDPFAIIKARDLIKLLSRGVPVAQVRLNGRVGHRSICRHCLFASWLATAAGVHDRNGRLSAAPARGTFLLPCAPDQNERRPLRYFRTMLPATLSRSGAWCATRSAS